MSASTHARPTPFKKRVLIPFWLAQLALILFFTVIYCLIESSQQQGANDFSIRYLIYIIICLTGILLSLIEILLFSLHKLKPINYLIFQAAQLFIWLAMFVKEVDISITQGDNSYPGYPHTTSSPAILFVAAHSALLFVFTGSLIYASVLYRHHCHSSKKPHFQSSPLTTDRISSPNHLTTTFPFPSNTPPPSLPTNTKTTAPKTNAYQGQVGVLSDHMTELPLRPPLPPYFERLSSIGRGADGGRMIGVGKGGGNGCDGEGQEVFELAEMRGGRGRRGAIALG